jgi:hypothetical protein
VIINKYKVRIHIGKSEAKLYWILGKRNGIGL